MSGVDGPTAKLSGKEETSYGGTLIAGTTMNNSMV